MFRILVAFAIVACVSARPSPGYLVSHEAPIVHATSLVPVVHSAKSTITKSSHVINHGSTSLVHAPASVVHYAPVYRASPVIHATLVHPPAVHATLVHPPAVHATLVHPPVVHATLVHPPAVHATLVHPPAVHATLVHSPAVYSAKTGDSAVSHTSSEVHHTVPLIAVHH